MPDGKHEYEDVKPAITPEMIEAEITPGMVRAGVEVLCAMDTRFEDDADVVTEIFVAMTLAKIGTDGRGWAFRAAHLRSE